MVIHNPLIDRMLCRPCLPGKAGFSFIFKSDASCFYVIGTRVLTQRAKNRPVGGRAYENPLLSVIGV